MDSSQKADGNLADDLSAGVECLTTGEAEELPPPPRRFAGLRSSAVTQSKQDRGDESSTAIESKPGKAAGGPKRFVRQAVPDEILNDEGLNTAISVLPANYNFEIHKTVWRVKKDGIKSVALQFPEGLLMFSCAIADILRKFAGVEEILVMGDVTFGACCIDDLSAAALGSELVVHYGHSCLVPLDATTVPVMYVFVDIKCDVEHLVATVRHNFDPSARLAVAGTIQFASSLQEARTLLAETHSNIQVPQCKPLSPGEVLGCTAPVLPLGEDGKEAFDALVFIADGRFHLEAMMIANPSTPAYRYDPYSRTITKEEYDQGGMRQVRRRAIEAAKGASFFGVILGTLGRQGNPRIVEQVCAELQQQGRRHVVVLLSEISPQKLAMMRHVDAWIQVACPRLSIDWGEGFQVPTLTPFEAWVALGKVPGFWEREGCDGGATDPYPMDYYDRDGGEWNSTYHRKPAGGRARKPRAAREQPGGACMGGAAEGAAPATAGSCRPCGCGQEG